MTAEFRGARPAVSVEDAAHGSAVAGRHLVIVGATRNCEAALEQPFADIVLSVETDTGVSGDRRRGTTTSATTCWPTPRPSTTADDRTRSSAAHHLIAELLDAPSRPTAMARSPRTSTTPLPPGQGCWRSQRGRAALVTGLRARVSTCPAPATPPAARRARIRSCHGVVAAWSLRTRSVSDSLTGLPHLLDAVADVLEVVGVAAHDHEVGELALLDAPQPIVDAQQAGRLEGRRL